MHPIEEKLYEMAGEELFSKRVIHGVWAKAFAISQGDEARTKAAYIELRVAQLREKFAAEAALRSETSEQRRIREIAMIRARFGVLRNLPYCDDENIPNSEFDGNPSDLNYPICASAFADALGCTETDIIIAIRTGYVVGVRYNGDWYVDLQSSPSESIQPLVANTMETASHALSISIRRRLWIVSEEN